MEKHRSFRHPLIAEDGVRCAQVHPVAGEDRDRDKHQLREPLVLRGLGHRLIDVSKHRYDGDKMNNAKNDPFCAGFHKVVPYANSVEASARVASRFALHVGLLANIAVGRALSAGRIARPAGRIVRFPAEIATTEGRLTSSRQPLGPFHDHLVNFAANQFVTGDLCRVPLPRMFFTSGRHAQHVAVSVFKKESARRQTCAGTSLDLPVALFPEYFPVSV